MDQPRWPRGAPDDEHGHGQGGRWASALSAAMGAAGGAAQMLHGLMTHDRVAGYLGRTDYEVFGHAGGANGQVEFRRYLDGTRLAYKTLSDFARNDSEAKAEVESSLIGHAIGAPVAAAVHDPQYPRTGILMQYIDDAVGDDEGARNTAYNNLLGYTGGGYRPLGAKPDGPTDPRAAMLGLLDTLIGNSDRHHANLRHSQTGVVGIDHGGALRAGRYQGGTVQTMYLSHGGLTESVLGYRDSGDPGTASWAAELQQTYYSRGALREARRRIEPLRGHLRPGIYDGVLRTIDKLIEITPETGGRDLGQ